MISFTTGFLLARRIDARHTIDTDLAYSGIDIEEAIEELKRIGSIDLGDFLIFRADKREPIATEQEYRGGVRMKFIPVMAGIEQKPRVSIDLVTEKAFVEEPDVITPANLISLPGLANPDYLVQPVPSAMADKICAIMETHETMISSSRIKDLVDLVSYITHDAFTADGLSQEVYTECKFRKMNQIRIFSIPGLWREGQFKQSYEHLAKEAHVIPDYRNIDRAGSLSRKCINPAISGNVSGSAWDPQSLSWQ